MFEAHRVGSGRLLLKQGARPHLGPAAHAGFVRENRTRKIAPRQLHVPPPTRLFDRRERLPSFLRDRRPGASSLRPGRGDFSLGHAKRPPARGALSFGWVRVGPYRSRQVLGLLAAWKIPPPAGPPAGPAVAGTFPALGARLRAVVNNNRGPEAAEGPSTRKRDISCLSRAFPMCGNPVASGSPPRGARSHQVWGGHCGAHRKRV